MPIKSGLMGGNGGASNLMSMINAYQSFAGPSTETGEAIGSQVGADVGGSAGGGPGYGADAMGRRQSDIAGGIGKSGLNLGLNIAGSNAAKPIGKSKIASGNRQSGFGTAMQIAGTIASLV